MQLEGWQEWPYFARNALPCPFPTAIHGNPQAESKLASTEGIIKMSQPNINDNRAREAEEARAALERRAAELGVMPFDADEWLTGAEEGETPGRLVTSTTAVAALHWLRPKLFDPLERKPHPKLNLTARRRRFGDGAELWRVHKAVGRAEVRVVERVEEFRAKLESSLFRQGELTMQGEVERLHAGAVDRVPSHVSESERRRGGKGRGVEPHVRRMRAGAEDGLARVVGANRILSEQGSAVGRVAKDGDRERKSALRLKDC